MPQLVANLAKKIQASRITSQKTRKIITTHYVVCNGRQLLRNPLREKPEGGYEMDFGNLRTVVEDFNSRGKGRVKMLIMSNPHNPAGICRDSETLARLADFGKEHGFKRLNVATQRSVPEQAMHQLAVAIGEKWPQKMGEGYQGGDTVSPREN